jgi:hypothetical protein
MGDAWRGEPDLCCSKEHVHYLGSKIPWYLESNYQKENALA